MAEWVWINGEVRSSSETGISVRDRGFLLGEGVFETIRLANGVLWKAGYHASRLQRGLKGIGIPVHLDEEILTAMGWSLSGASGITEGVLRVSVSAGEGGRGLTPGAGAEPMVLATLDSLPGGSESGIDVVTTRYRRDAGDPTSEWKTLSWLPMVLARREALAAGKEEGLLLNHEGEPCCFASGNLLIWDGKVWRTPGPGSGALPGTTMAWLADRGMGGHPLHPSRLSKEELLCAEGIYLVNTIRGLVPVDHLDGQAFPSRDLTVYAMLSQFLDEERAIECAH